MSKRKKEIHVITNSGCAQFPKDSIHPLQIDEDGIRWTINGVNSIHPSVDSKKVYSERVQGKMCRLCGNMFNYNGSKAFRGDICSTCHKRLTKTVSEG